MNNVVLPRSLGNVEVRSNYLMLCMFNYVNKLLSEVLRNK